ncbi:MAG: tRNA lysidine(34) synthetase TilS [Candidatus Omnitrophota bacterium]|nr:MAG: tRNA lysidine(34) synthetase TilS [Candidatus Omnitrophota bacterium]
MKEDLFVRKVKETIKRHSLFSEREKIIVSVSGGADSVALLLVLHSLKEELELTLWVAHFNHQIRGEEAEEDRRFVLNLARDLNLPFAEGEGDVCAYAEKKRMCLEEAGRILRYEFFLQMAKEKGAGKIALGHNRDDQIETVLMHLMRGAGAQGLGGMFPKRVIDREVEVIRPLIENSREEILGFLKRKGMGYREDRSNRDTLFLRNRVRYRLLPYLRRYNPQIDQVLFNLSETLREENDYLQKVSEDLFSQIAYREKEKVFLDLSKFYSLHLALQRRLFRLAVERVKGDLRGVEYQHWQSLSNLINKERKRFSLSLPGVCIRREGEMLVFSREKEEKGSFFSFLIDAPGRRIIPEIQKEIIVSLFPREKGFAYKGDKYTQFFDANEITFPLEVRSRLPADRINPLGMKGSKKLKEVFIEAKVPQREKDKIPLILCNGKVIWVCGLKRAEQGKIKPQTKRILKIELRSRDGKEY